MERKFRELQLEQMDALLASWRAAQISSRPKLGWVRAIRESLGMSAVAFARRLGMSVAGVSKLENAEASDSITLASLRKLADALDCELQYVLLPRTSLKQHLKDRARLVVSEQMRPITQSMALEGQSVEESQNKFHYEMAIKELLEGSRRELW
jgi:predicted DNA-binding mobile mystery protein A